MAASSAVRATSVAANGNTRTEWRAVTWVVISKGLPPAGAGGRWQGGAGVRSRVWVDALSGSCQDHAAMSGYVRVVAQAPLWRAYLIQSWVEHTHPVLAYCPEHVPIHVS